VANFWPRRWYPHKPGKNQKPGAPKYTGEYEDGFGNKITVHAVSNPQISGKEPAGLHDRSPGYAIARFNRTTREISLENWPRWADPLKSGEGPYPGWPVKFYQQDNYGRKALAYLPEIVYTIRTNKSSFRPKIFQDSLYTVVVGEPGTNRIKSLKGILTIGQNDQKTLTVIFSDELL
jgi:alkaline phosphatase D